jgi:hypothetical protein
METWKMREQPDSLSANASVQTLDRAEFLDLVLSRRRIEREWSHFESELRLRDLDTGARFVLRPRADSGAAERLPAPRR